MAHDQKSHIDTFGFPPGRTLANKYEVISRLGAGWEGEVYLLREKTTGIDRAAKFFFPERNKRNKTLTFYARKLHKLRECPSLIQYHTQETIHFEGHDISFLVSDYVEGEILQDFIESQPGQRLDPFQGLHLLYAIAKAIEGVHKRQDYHGDLHSQNVIIRRRGLGFDVKLLDFFHWGQPTQENLRDDICDVIRIFYDALGGKSRYARQSATVKEIILGLKKTLILRKFRSITTLCEHLEQLAWDQPAHYN